MGNVINRSPAFDPKWGVNFGPGFGFTDATDKLVLKLIVGRRINWSKKHI
jgi:hypothetical protein